MLKFLRTGTVGIRETFGKFSEICPPGLTLYIPFAQTIRVVNTQQNQLNLKLDARTSDNAFAHVSLTIQYRIDPENAAKALYRMNDPVRQMYSSVESIVRRSVPTMTMVESLLSVHSFFFVIADGGVQGLKQDCK